jgi:hypothetical protein
MNRLSFAVAAAMLALPASAAAAPTRGVVLSVNAGHHTIQVVDGKHRAHAYRYRGSLPKLHPGSRISFGHRGHTINHVRVAPGQARTVSFYGRVVRSNASGITLRLGGGGTVSFSSKQVSAVRKRINAQWHRWRSLSATALHATTGNTIVNINGLAPGTIVLITATIADGHTTITVTLPAGSQGSRGGSGGQSGNQSASQTGSGDQSDDNGDDTGGDAVGTITQLSTTAVTINVGGRSMTFSCDPEDDLTDGFATGDLVDVTYDSSNGSNQASDVEYVEADATGTVTAVDTTSLTLTNSDTGQTQTIVADPAEDMFDGVSVGDEVVVTYHQSAGQLIADVVDDETAGN